MGSSPSGITSASDLDAAFRSLQDKLRGFVRKRVRSPEVTDDLVQDVFAKAVKAIESGRVPANLAGWLYAAARTTIVDHYRSRREGEIELSDDLATAESDPSLERELSDCLRPLAASLPARYRDTLLRTDFDGRTMGSVAAEDGVSLSAVKSRASRARALLKSKLLECCQVERTGTIIHDYRPRAPGCTRCGPDAALAATPAGPIRSMLSNPQHGGISRNGDSKPSERCS